MRTSPPRIARVTRKASEGDPNSNIDIGHDARSPDNEHHRSVPMSGADKGSETGARKNNISNHQNLIVAVGAEESLEPYCSPFWQDGGLRGLPFKVNLGCS